MTQSMYLVYRSRPDTGGVPQVDGVLTVLTNAATSADALLNAVGAANAYKNVILTSQNTDYTNEMETDYTSNPSDAFDANYFDSFVVVSSAGGVPGSGNGSTDGDAYVFPERSAPVYVSHTQYSPI